MLRCSHGFEKENASGPSTSALRAFARDEGWRTSPISIQTSLIPPLQNGMDLAVLSTDVDLPRPAADGAIFDVMLIRSAERVDRHLDLLAAIRALGRHGFHDFVTA